MPTLHLLSRNSPDCWHRAHAAVAKGDTCVLLAGTLSAEQVEAMPDVRVLCLEQPSIPREAFRQENDLTNRHYIDMHELVDLVATHTPVVTW